MIRRDIGRGAGSVDLSRVELEQLARERAERLLTPAARAEQNAPELSPARALEPTLEERLAAIDRRWTQYANGEKKSLALDLLDAAKKKFAAAVARTTDEDVRHAADLLRHAERLGGG